MKKKRIVIALGHDALGTTLPEQQAAAKKTAKAIADFVKEDYQIIISHSNGPQVGMIHTAMSEFCKIYPEYTATPMSVCSAMSQGYIGYDLQNAIRTELLNRGIYKPVATVLTQMTVDPYDDAFYHPTKIIGRIMSAEEAEAEEKKGNHVVEVENRLKGASAVIEKDLAAGKLAEAVDADMLVILTGVEKVCLEYGTASEQPIDHMTTAQAKKYMEEGQFGEGTMKPKVEAALNFIGNSAVKSVLITKLGSGSDLEDGTVIKK